MIRLKSVLFVLAVLFAAIANAQQPNSYYAYRESSLSSSTEVITVQQPASSPSKTVRFTGFTVYSSVAVDVTLEYGGTAASTTALTVGLKPGTAAATTVNAYRSSNVGSGTTISKYTIPAGSTVPVPLTNVMLDRTVSGNVSLRTSSVTGTVRIYLEWIEE